MINIRRETYESGMEMETKVDNDGILWLNERHTEEELDHKRLCNKISFRS